MRAGALFGGNQVQGLETVHLAVFLRDRTCEIGRIGAHFFECARVDPSCVDTSVVGGFDCRT